MTFEPTEEEELTAASIVDEALAPFQTLVPADVLDEIRAALVDRLTIEPEGRRLLRAAMADPTVEASGDVARGAGAAAAEKQKSGSG